MKWIMVDVEADGPIPGDYSMVSFGAVLVKHGALDETFYAELNPISDRWMPDALDVSAFSREDTLTFPDPAIAMVDFDAWLKEHAGNRPRFIADNNGFDWSFINWYFHHFLSRNPFGHSSSNLGDLYKGMVKNTFKSFKHLRISRHTHNPVDDAMGNAEALIKMIGMGLNLKV